MSELRSRAAPRVVDTLLARIRRRPDSEFQQAIIRVVIGVVFLAYFSSQLAPLDVVARSAAQWVSAAFTGAALLIAALTLIDLGASPVRRLVAMTMDYATCSFLLTYTGEAGSPLLVVYLWVTLGNGFRYGVNYLYAATGMAVTGFLMVLIFSAYWSNHMAIGVAFLLSMIAVPLYSASLLKQLHHAIQRERSASLAKTNFLANMSHELRTPLNGVIGVADLLTGTKLDKEQKEFAQIIHASAHTLLELIDNVLDISRIEAGRVNSLAEDFDLHRLVNGTVAMMDAQARAKGLVLAVHIAPQTPFALNGDARHLRQVLINLMGNAIKFTEDGRVDVYIRPVGQAHPQRLRFEIVDTGIGIAEDVQARIFESFTQADPSVTRRFGGSGLGTTIAKQLVEALGGQIGLHSRLGEGTTLWFELPFAVRAADATAGGPQFELPMRVAVLTGGELALRIQSMIRAWGGEAFAVENTTRLAAELASHTARGEPLAAVVVERASLPGDPVACLGLLRHDPQLSALPVIMIESDPSTSTVRDAQWVRAGFASVLRTPVNSTLLFNAIHAAVSHEMPHNVVSLASHFQAQAGQAAALRVLVAEDNPVNQRVICGLLEHAGHQVFLARDGEEALTMLEADDNAYDLAIVDMHMPQLSGPELVQRWRFMEHGHLPIVMLTADARAEAQVACEQAGADTFLTKPVNSRELVEVIAALTAARAPVATRAATPESPPEELDESVLDNLAQIGGASFVKELVTSFEEDSVRALRDVESALAARDHERWHDNLHMLKGGARDMGAVHLAQLCADAERVKPYEMSADETTAKLEAVRQALSDVRSALAAYLDRKLRAESV